LRGLISQNLGVLDETVPFVRVELLEVLQNSDTRVRLVLTDNLTQRQQDLLTVMRDQHAEGGHVVNGQRLGHRSRQGLGEERNTTLSLAAGGEELGLERLVFLGHEEGGCTQSTLALLFGRDLVVQQLLDMVNGQQMLTVH